LNNSDTGADGINPRVVIGSLIIKHMCDLSNREVVQQIQENIYMQYFIGYSSFSDEEPFDPSLFVEFHKRLGIEQINAINEKILHMANQKTEEAATKQQYPPSSPPKVVEAAPVTATTTPEPVVITHEGKLIVDATACPQDISYPTDLNLLSDSREKAEELIDFLFNPKLHEKKPSTYRQKARKDYLKTAQKKKKNKERNTQRFAKTIMLFEKRYQKHLQVAGQLRHHSF
jgi:hypothetical protein